MSSIHRMQDHRLSVRVYLEDTDAQGIVYHANYLKYCERARTDLLAQSGFELAALQKEGWIPVVYQMRLRFQRPARLHDELEVRSVAKRTSDYRIEFQQEVFLRGAETPIFIAEAIVVTIDHEGELCPLPENLLVS